jgi:hypothetical protein
MLSPDPVRRVLCGRKVLRKTDQSSTIGRLISKLVSLMGECTGRTESDSLRAVHLKAQVKMRILHVVRTYFPAIRYGGPIYSVHAHCPSLAAAGHERRLALATLSGVLQ